MTTRSRLEKHAGAGQIAGKTMLGVSNKLLFPAIGIGSIAAYEGGKRSINDLKRGRDSRLQREEEAREMIRNARMGKYAAAPQLFTREAGQVFPLASESGAISWRQSYLDGLLANKNAMGKMAREQLGDLFPASAGHTGHVHGYRQRSMVSGKDAGSSLLKAFKAK